MPPFRSLGPNDQGSRTLLSNRGCERAHKLAQRNVTRAHQQWHGNAHLTETQRRKGTREPTRHGGVEVGIYIIRRSHVSSAAQGSLHSVLTYCPATASSAWFCLLCCQPEPVPRSLSCQDIVAYATSPLQTTCLARVSHQHSLQDLLSSLTIHRQVPEGDKGDEPPTVLWMCANAKGAARR